MSSRGLGPDPNERIRTASDEVVQEQLSLDVYQEVT